MILLAHIYSTPLLVSHIKLISFNGYKHLRMWLDPHGPYMVITGAANLNITSIYTPIKDPDHTYLAMAGCIMFNANAFIHAILLCEDMMVSMYTEDSTLRIIGKSDRDSVIVNIPFERTSKSYEPYHMPYEGHTVHDTVCTIYMSPRSAKDIYICNRRLSKITIIAKNGTLFAEETKLDTLSVVGSDCIVKFDQTTDLQHIEARYDGTVLVRIRGNGTKLITIKQQCRKCTAFYIFSSPS